MPCVRVLGLVISGCTCCDQPCLCCGCCGGGDGGECCCCCCCCSGLAEREGSWEGGGGDEKEGERTAATGAGGEALRGDLQGMDRRRWVSVGSGRFQPVFPYLHTHSLFTPRSSPHASHLAISKPLPPTTHGEREA